MNPSPEPLPHPDTGAASTELREVPIRPASTVVMVRASCDEPSGSDAADATPSEAEAVTAASSRFEVFMVRRNPRSEFVGGAFVFPGGAVDPADSEVDHLVCDLDDATASRLLGLRHGGLAWLVAAARELFEEAGILLAVDGSGAPIDPEADPAFAARMTRCRAKLNARETTFRSILESLGVRLALADLHFFSHWVTPPGQPRRYDTRFFLCRKPPAQDPAHEGEEATDSVWISPQAAMAAAARGTMTIIFPTLKNLERLASFDSIDELLQWARDTRPEVTRPRVSLKEGSLRILLPGEEGYEEAGVWRERGT